MSSALPTGVDTAASFQNMDVLVEPTWKCLRRLAEVSALKPAASNKHKYSHAAKYPTKQKYSQMNPTD
ncbi:hypothetical protein SVI_0021 [Shewanella violacea DSS12]|uniref:Uncharacterized protein n=1 Tax=Shewanella violacea (strain JCM 10179 / CIP 106290 / LMG 19151 / DSS12) TaxID=637905 RepID=D4ZD70_SHEVD|nr:hypothetical protein SVI_0021 [Shewanella violacea DSS12]